MSACQTVSILAEGVASYTFMITKLCLC